MFSNIVQQIGIKDVCICVRARPRCKDDKGTYRKYEKIHTKNMDTLLIHQLLTKTHRRIFDDIARFLGHNLTSLI